MPRSHVMTFLRWLCVVLATSTIPKMFGFKFVLESSALALLLSPHHKPRRYIVFWDNKWFFSRGMQLFISTDHLSIRRGESDFHDTAMHFLATHRATSMNFSCALVREWRILVKFPNKQSSGSTATFTPVILVKVEPISCQKGLTFIHSQVQCKKEPTSVSHLKHISDRLDLNECNFSGVSYNWCRKL